MDRDETELERWDRNFAELLQELRVAQTGVQILFAFLLTLPFAARFGEATGLQRTLYVITLLAAASAAALLIAPVSYHRHLFRKGRKPDIVRTASWLTRAGLAALLVSMIGSVYLALDVVAGLPLALGLGTALTAGYVYLWYLLPLIGERRGAGPRRQR